MKICILYNISNNSIKYFKWHDGFTKAINILKKIYTIDLINSYDNKIIDFNNYDLVFFKESFEGSIYKKYKNKLLPKNKLGLFISSSNIIPTDKQLKLYKILFYETQWYYNYAKLNRHNNTYHAFGVDTEIMKPLNIEKEYDVIFVGNICDYKRPLNILNLSGKKICLGFKTDKKIINELENNNVEIKEFIEYDELVNYYNKSKLCYIPCKLHGGGERAVLEARACGIKVKIEDDNSKLDELCSSIIYSSEYYAKQIEKGIYNIIYNEIKELNYEKILKYFNNFKFNILEVGGMDGKTFDPLYNNSSDNWNITILEPIPYQFNKLQLNYKDKKNVSLINKALNYTNENTIMYSINNEHLNNIPSWANGISSFYNSRNSIGENYWNTRGKIHKNKGITYDTIKDSIIKINVKCSTLKELNLGSVNILQVDTEGFDYHILNIVLEKYKPYVILFEWNNLPENELEKAKILLNNYKLTFNQQDALCILKNL